MNRLYLFFLLTLASVVSLTAQIKDPVKWTTEVEKISESEYNLVFKAAIEPHWHLYSQELPEGGALPTTFSFEGAGEGYELIGKTEESPSITEYDKVFEMELSYFDEEATFTQKIKLKDASLATINAAIEFQACDDESCIFDSTELSFVVNENAVDEQSTEVAAKTATEKSDANEGQVATKDKKEKKKGLLTIFLIAFFSGFAALLTPCVFPMIPMTVSFFTKQSKTRAAGIKNAIIYGISIVVIYVLLGSLVTAVFGADSLNALSTNVWFNIIFFILLVVFAASFLGAFEIVLPNSWANKVDRQADRGGIIGILFMALALAIVSFSCTGPIVGTLLVEAASKGGAAPIIGMLGFSLALALPFMLFAMFPGWLNSLPKSGGWLNSVKVFLGFLELALAFKFLSNADLVLQLHWLEREVFIAIWIAVFGVLAMYLFGKISLPHDSPLQHISVGRLGLGLLVLSFTIYLIPGLWGAPLKLISGFPPPMHYSESPYGVGFTKTGGGGAAHAELPEGAHHGPQDIVAFLDYDKGMAYAKEVGKPVMIDFTGHACVNCRKMEERVWSEDQILNILNNDIVLISLYVDDKRPLPESEQYVSDVTGKNIKTIGNKWSDFQITKYKANAQPYYVLVDNDGNNLNDPVGYTPDVDDYEAWLKDGISNYKK
ncbi:thiol:disulfide interchange protein DsbD [Zhouia amylolytica]|uniref:Thiol:disulfide interchange protein DsbD 2 n=2 Tax=Zhouia amylolytica TaxID=376730 RepID=W2UQD5_9FLAO|nr:thioredoxin family protein [Zhouia amylolytica]ETN95706.1 thiol:disulfide interchange protein DsbD 2 [Zhouia amylolytica AD3]SFS56318.1 thiol:disulfide interchange protein DsbD [Zhouia amylolytica]